MTDKPRVLIYEQDDVLRVLLFTVLRHQLLDVDSASNPEEAFTHINRCDYAVAIVDFDGDASATTEFLARFRETRPGASTFVIALRDPRKDVAFDPSTVSAVLLKPVEIDTLAEIVRECAPLVPQPADPRPCPAAESDIRSRLARGSSAPN